MIIRYIAPQGLRNLINNTSQSQTLSSPIGGLNSTDSIIIINCKQHSCCTGTCQKIFF